MTVLLQIALLSFSLLLRRYERALYSHDLAQFSSTYLALDVHVFFPISGLPIRAHAYV